MLLTFTTVLICSVSASDAESPKLQALKSGWWGDGLMCAVGAMITPTISVLFTMVLCMITYIDDVFGCMFNNESVATASTVIMVAGLCVVDPPPWARWSLMD
jgi:hypothetical protein